MSFTLVSLLGLTEAEAVIKIKEAGLRSRIKSRNGKAFVGTEDVNLNRVNLHVENDLVVRAYFG
jgi:hypothetical protein